MLVEGLEIGILDFRTPESLNDLVGNEIGDRKRSTALRKGRRRVREEAEKCLRELMVEAVMSVISVRYATGG